MGIRNAIVNTILEWTDYHRAEQAVEDRLNGIASSDESFWDDFFKDYDHLLKLRDRGFPLLLREGRPHLFDPPPVSAYLLPKQNEATSEKRWLLAIFILPDGQGAVQVLAWNDSEQGASVQPLGEQPMPIKYCQHRLDRLPLDLQCTHLGDTALVVMVFPQGTLTLIVDAKLGVTACTWKNQDPPPKDFEWIQRSSWGNMPIIARFKRYQQTSLPLQPIRWQDDLILNADATINKPLTTQPLGRIRGADTADTAPNRLYLASNRGEVCRIDTTQSDTLVRSEQLPDEILDVLAVPQEGQAIAYAILAVAKEGAVYLLLDNGKELVTRHWQHPGSHVWRLIGRGDRHLLALDKRGLLTPLRLHDMGTFHEIRRKATDELTGRYLLHQPCWQLPDETKALDLLNKNPQQLLRLGVLALEYFFHHLDDNGFVETFALWLEQLNELYQQLNSQQRQDLACLQRRSLRRTLRWLVNSCFSGRFKGQWAKEFSSIGHALHPALEVIFSLLSPHLLSPDDLWLTLLRRHDWVEHWARFTGLDKQPPFKQRLDRFREQIKQRRRDFLPALAGIRPLNTLASYRFLSHVSHLDILDEEKGWLAVLESGVGLHLLQAPMHIGEEWQELAPLLHCGIHWEGQTSFVRCLPPGNGETDYRLLVGTMRGNLVWLKWSGLGQPLQPVEKRPSAKSKDCGFAITCSHYLPKHDVILLGGRDANGKACLYGLESGKPLDQLKRLWQDQTDDPSTLRMLRGSADGKRLWGVNRDLGRLYAWELKPWHFRGNLPDPQPWLQGVNKLHCLEYSARQGLLVCGGEGGMVWALDSDTGVMRWVVQCVGNLRHIRYLQDYREADVQGAWLLTSDDGGNLLVDRHGQVLGVIEQLSPVSALKGCQQRLLLATQTGRLLVMGCADPASNPNTVELSRHSGRDRRNPDCRDATNPYPPCTEGQEGLYPLRSHMQTETETSLRNRLPQILFTESLAAMMSLQRAADYLVSQPLSPAVAEAIAEFFFHAEQTLARRIVFLYRLRRIWPSKLPEANAIFILELLQRCWRELLIESPDFLCKLLSPILDLLNRLLELAVTAEDAKQLRLDIRRAVWQGQGCPSGMLGRSGAWTAIRLMQALKCWKKPESNDDLSKAQALSAWCNALAIECEAEDASALRECLMHLISAHLRLLPMAGPWWVWLGKLAKAEFDTTPPEPLNALLPGIGQPPQPLLEPSLQQLSGLFGDNPPWSTWLVNLQGILISLNNTCRHSPHDAWREYNDWLRLREHLVGLGAERFSVAQQQSLLALFWSQLLKNWTEAIQTGLDGLEQRIFNDPSVYLAMETQDRWHGDDSVDLELTFLNRFRSLLELRGFSWNGADCGQQGLRLPLPTGKPVAYKLRLEAKDNRLDGTLGLDCREVETGKPVCIEKNLAIDRGVSRLSAEPIWDATWNRLLGLLEDFQHSGRRFVWIDGATWTKEERTRLIQDMEYKYKFSVDVSSNSDEVPPLIWGGVGWGRYHMAWFSPDIALGAAAETQLAQIHALLSHLPGGRTRLAWALGLWHWSQGLPPRVAAILAKDLPDTEAVASVLQRLLGAESPQDKKITAIHHALQALPTRAFGAWCAEEPFYAPKASERLSAEELYLPAAMALDESLWTRLDAAPVDELAQLFGVDIALAKTQQLARSVFSNLRPVLFGVDPGKMEEGDNLAQTLLAKLGAGAVVYVPDGAWCLDINLSLNWHDYPRCWLLPAGTAVQRASMVNKPVGLWLCLGETSAPKELPGLALALSARDVLALLHAEKPTDALLWLNRLAAAQHGVDASNAFRSNGGLAHLVGVHFYGRRLELQKLKACLHNVDRRESGVDYENREAALLVGGRRMGKTSLRERIQYEIAVDGGGRVCCAFNFEAMPTQLHGVELERWFCQRVVEAYAKTAYPFKFSWPDQYKDSPRYRDDFRSGLHRHLQAIKRKTGKTPLWTFDETEWLARADSQLTIIRADSQQPRRWGLFSFFRQLLSQAEVCLFATSYPHTAEQFDTLIIANQDSTGPIHNTFTQILRLAPWSPHEAWDFLHSRLAGLGVLLPHRYRDEMLAISRGVIWVVHEFGRALCEALPKAATVKIIDSASWRKARKQVLEQIGQALKIPVENAARRQDGALGLSLLNQPEAVLQGNLWRVLCDCARLVPIRPSEGGEDWPDEDAVLLLEDLQQHLPQASPTAVHMALAELVSSPALEGLADQPGVYHYAQMLLPAWLQYSSQPGER